VPLTTRPPLHNLQTLLLPATSAPQTGKSSQLQNGHFNREFYTLQVTERHQDKPHDLSVGLSHTSHIPAASGAKALFPCDILQVFVEAAIGIEPMNKGFADLCLTAWLRRPINTRCTNETEQCGAIEIITSIAPHKPKLLFALSPARNRKSWSGRRDLNSRLSPWQGDTLPLSYSRFGKPPLYESSCRCQAQFENGPGQDSTAKAASCHYPCTS
jgi:hypothetical protein